MNQRFPFFLSLSLFCIWTISGMAQRFDYYYRTAEDDRFINAIEDAQGNFFLLCVIDNKDGHTLKSAIIKLDHQGKFLDKYELNLCTFASTYIDKNNHLYVLGVVENELTGLLRLNFWKFDSLLNLMWSKGFGTRATAVWSDQLNFDASTDEFYFVGYENQNNYWRSFIGKVDLNGDSVLLKFHDYGGSFAPYFEVKKRSMEFLVSALFVPYPTSEYASQLLVLDSNFNLDTAIYLEGKYDNIVGQVEFGNRVSFTTIGDSSILIDGRVNNDKTGGKTEFDFACMRLHGNLKEDTTFVIETRQVREQPGFSHISRNGKYIYGALLSGLDEDDFYYSSSVNNFYLAKLDHNGRILHDFYYSNKSYLTYSGVLATNDGGALLYGASYLEGFNGEMERDAYAIKVDSNGLADITPAGIESVAIQDKLCSIYPNPASDRIQISNIDEKNDCHMTVFNLSGEEVLYKQLKNNVETVDVSNLPKGLYLLRIRNGHFSVNFKFVKQ